MICKKCLEEFNYNVTHYPPGILEKKIEAGGFKWLHCHCQEQAAMKEAKPELATKDE